MPQKFHPPSAPGLNLRSPAPPKSARGATFFQASPPGGDLLPPAPPKSGPAAYFVASIAAGGGLNWNQPRRSGSNELLPCECRCGRGVSLPPAKSGRGGNGAGPPLRPSFFRSVDLLRSVSLTPSTTPTQQVERVVQSGEGRWSGRWSTVRGGARRFFC